MEDKGNFAVATETVATDWVAVISSFREARARGIWNATPEGVTVLGVHFPNTNQQLDQIERYLTSISQGTQ